jgi:TM2 domain-containing membrane protein YozV
MKLKLLLIALLIGFFPYQVMAADLTSLTDHLRDQMDVAKLFALNISFLIGLFIFIFGLNSIYKDSKQPGQDHLKKGLIGIGVGTLMLIVPIVITIAGGTFGDDNNAYNSIFYDAAYDPSDSPVY